MSRRLLILGAHSAVAKNLVECLEERGLEAEIIRATTTEWIGPELVLVDEAMLSAADLVVAGAGGEVFLRLAEAAAERQKPVLDVAGLGSARGEALWPMLDRAEDRLAPGGVYQIATGLASSIGSVLVSMAPLCPEHVFVSTYESAACLDQPGMDSLLDETRAVFTMQEPGTSLFPDTLAFNVVPRAPESLSRVPGWSSRLAEDLKAAYANFGRAEGSLSVMTQRAWVPSLTAEAAAVHLCFRSEVPRDRVEACLRGARGVHYRPESLVSAQAAVGRDDALAGHLEVEGTRATLWIAADRLRRGSASLAALAVERFVSV